MNDESSTGVRGRGGGGDVGDQEGSGRGRAPETTTIYPRVRLPILALCLKEHIDRATLSHRLRDLTRRPWLLFERYVPSSCHQPVHVTRCATPDGGPHSSAIQKGKKRGKIIEEIATKSEMFEWTKFFLESMRISYTFMNYYKDGDILSTMPYETIPTASTLRYSLLEKREIF